MDNQTGIPLLSPQPALLASHEPPTSPSLSPSRSHWPSSYSSDRHERRTVDVLTSSLPFPLPFQLPSSASSASASASTHSDLIPLHIIQKPAQVYLSPYRAPTSPASPSPPPPPPPLRASAETLDECCAPIPAKAPRTPSRMGLTKTHRILILLGIDSAFFLVELIVGEWCSTFYIPIPIPAQRVETTLAD